MFKHKPSLKSLAEASKFVLVFPSYVYWRLRQTLTFGKSLLEVLMFDFNMIKQQLVSRMFWGRGGLYRNLFHILVTTLTALLLVSGVLAHIQQAEGSTRSLSVAYGTLGNDDLLQQGGSLTTAVSVDSIQPNYKLFTHVVVKGETLQQIAAQYGVSKDTIKWANDRILSPFNDNVPDGATLYIPEIDGVLYTAKKGDTVDKIVAATAGNRFDIIELNGLIPPDYSVTEGQKIFVPNGKLKAPPAPLPRPRVYRTPSGSPCIESGVGAAIGPFPAGTFGDPLCAVPCQGYVWMRGFTPWHEGVDLAKGGGCPIRSIGGGTVIYAGWKDSFTGYMVMVDHGGGVISEYWHGDGNIWVRKGDQVYRGQDLMYMGQTGNATGIHLHLVMKYNGVLIDPAPYVPYHR
jgi:murein DD-endopeptidase MepM/ murein hydrolase activator NlpD